MKPPLVSVLMTVYNRERYIATAIESVLSQSMEDFELIIVDDGSSDRSLEIAQRYTSERRVMVYRNDSNLGDYPNRNRAASLARGKYLKYVDSDDAIYPHCIETMTHMMEQHPSAGVLLLSWSENDTFYPFELTPAESYRRCFIHGERMSNSPCTTMYRHGAFRTLGSFDVRHPFGADWDMTLRMASIFPVLIGPIGSAFYREHPGQVISTQTTLTHNYTTEGIEISLKALRHPNCPLPYRERRWAIGRILRTALMFAASLAFKRTQYTLAIHFLKSLSVPTKDWLAVMNLDKPSVAHPSLGLEPSWSDYPRARTHRLMKNASPTVGDTNVSIMIAGPGTSKDWELTLRSALVQSEGHLEVIALTAPGSSDPDPVVLSKYPCVRQVSCSVNDLWLARNDTVRQASGQFLKFVTPGTLFYPYAAEFGAHALKVHPEYNFTAWGQLSTMPYLTALSPETAIACDLADGWQVFRVDLANAAVRKSAFLKAQGFDSTWGEWAAYELFFRLSMERGVIHGMFASSNRETTIWPGSAADMPPALRQHLEKLLTAVPGWQSWGDRPLELLANNAASLRQRALDGYTWDWSQYPWARPLTGLGRQCQPETKEPRRRTSAASLSSGE